MIPSHPDNWLLRSGLGVLLSLACFATLAQDSPYRPGPGRYPKFDGKKAEAGVNYGQVPGLPLPRTILYSVSPAVLTVDADSLVKLGFNAFWPTTPMA